MYREFKKSLGQNFLVDSHFIQMIFERIHIDQNSELLEIGPGDGKLTQELIKLEIPLKLIELDQKLIDILQKKFGENKLVEITEGDILKIDFNAISNSNLIFLGNLPYNISSQIILRLLESNSNFKYAIFLIQKELAERFIPQEKKSTKISLQAKFFADIEPLFNIPPTAFQPIPKVTSTLVKIVPHSNKYDFKKYEALKEILTVCFSEPRKQLVNPMKKLFSELPEFSFKLTSRAEDLALDDYFEILSKYEQ
mgnify:FL=1|tara:strand:- start:1839 stop:2597 length:759 start_codon:yes stop_codon:yes gene_type:complete